MKDILKAFWILQEKSNTNRKNKLGRGFSTAKRINPYNPLSYMAILIIAFVGIVMFGFVGICTKARVVYVVDGDTLDVVMFITLAQLCRSRKIGPKQESRTSALIQSGCEKAGFFMKIRLRLYGYDCIEKNTDNGKLATKILQEKLESINNIVWCQCIELNVSSPKYNRTIAVIYEDPECTKCLNEYLYQMEKKLQIKMVHPYTGGTKKEF